MKHKDTLEIKTSDRFMKAYKKAIFSLKGLAEGAIHDFVNRYRSDPKTVLHNYDRVAHMNLIVELDITGAHRLLVLYQENQLLLLDMGRHEIVSRYNKIKFATDLVNNSPAPKQFWPEHQSKIFSSYPDKSAPLHYPEEISSEWLYFLEDEQLEIFEAIAEDIISEENKLHFIMGGPGTGKTCLLLNLLKFFTDLDHRTGLIMSKNLAAYIEASTHSNISQYYVDLYTCAALDLLLIDDPRSLSITLQSMRWDQVQALVIAFDPLQLPDDLTDKKFEKLVSDYGILAHSLSGCYRQKENVGKATKHVIDVVAASTPFLHQTKIKSFHKKRKRLTQLSNELMFLNPHGYAENYPDATVIDVLNEVNRIRQYEWLMWKHCPGLLVLLDECKLSEESLIALSPLLQRGYVKTASFNSIEDIKGLEFQHVFIFIKRHLFNEIQHGFEGSGQNVYHRRRLLRIPFSRAKDSLVVFAIENEST